MARCDARGFTLTELLVVISIIGIGAAMTFAVGAGFLRGNKLSQAARITHAALLETRSRAIATRLKTSMVIYRSDNLAVMTDEKWEPIGQPVAIPEPCIYYIYEGKDFIAAGWAINKVAPLHDIMTITFERTGSCVKNLPGAYWNRETKGGAIFVNIIDPTISYGACGGRVTSDDGETVDLTVGTWALPDRGYCVIGDQLVSYNSLGRSADYRARLQGLQRNIFGSGSEGSLEGKYVYPAGFCGNIMVVCATGHVVTVMM